MRAEIKALGQCELLCQLAEEASELAQAALKLRRAIDGTNPTPKLAEDCMLELIEEIADVQIIFDYIDFPADLGEAVDEIIRRKEKRWATRLAARDETIEHVGYSEEQLGRDK